MDMFYQFINNYNLMCNWFIINLHKCIYIVWNVWDDNIFLLVFWGCNWQFSLEFSIWIKLMLYMILFIYAYISNC